MNHQRFADAEKVRAVMKERGIVPLPGATWVEVHGEIKTFFAHDDLDHVPEFRTRVLDKVIVFNVDNRSD